MSDWDVRHGCRSISGPTISRRSSTPPSVTEPVTLLGISQGASTLHPLRRSAPGARGADDSLRRLRARGAARAARPTRARAYQAMAELARVVWGSDNPTFRQVFTSRFIPGGTLRAAPVVQRPLPEDDDGRDCGRRCSKRAPDIDITASLREVRMPTLVMHAREDAVVPRRRRPPAGDRDSRRGVRRARFAQSRPARARAGVGALPRGRARVRASRTPLPTTRCSRRSRRASARCWR